MDTKNVAAAVSQLLSALTVLTKRMESGHAMEDLDAAKLVRRHLDAARAALAEER